MIGPTNLGSLILEGAPVVRLYQLALKRDPTEVELRDGRQLARSSGSLLTLANALTSGEEYRRLHGGAGDPRSLLERAAAPEAEQAALLPGLLAGVPPDEPTAYALWMQLYDQPPQAPPEVVQRLDGLSISLVMVLSDTEVEAALQSITSLRGQVHRRWRLHLATRLLSRWPRDALATAFDDDRVVQCPVAGPDLLVGAIGVASADAASEWMALLQPGDLLPPTALLEAACVIASSPEIAMLRTDEDVFEEGRRLPRFKPAWSSLTDDAVGQLAITRSTLLREAAASCASSANPFSTIARQAARLAGKGLVHYPAILCHRRPSRVEHEGRASRAALRPTSLTASVIVPTRNGAAFLATCAEGVLRRTDFPSLQLIIVDNGSDEPRTLELLDELAADRRVDILKAPGPFNFAALNNLAASSATGQLLVLLNNDVEIRDEGWLAELERLAALDEVGAVGARLLYPDGTIQHAGLLLGPEGAATHVGRHFPADEPGYLRRFERVCELSAVTGACLAIRRDVWQRVGGMDERLAVTFNDVDLCLRVRAAGLRVVWTPDATLIHHEAQSRGVEADDPARLDRFERERTILRATWGAAVDDDPFLNPNLLAMPSGHLVATRPRRARACSLDAPAPIATS